MVAIGNVRIVVCLLLDIKSRSVKPSTTAASDRFSRPEDAPVADDPSSHRSFPTSSRSRRTYFPTSWSDSRATSAPRPREPTTSDYTQVLKSPPVRDSVSTRRDYSDRVRFDSAPRHSSLPRREHSSLPTRGYDDGVDRPLSPSGASSVGSVHDGSESVDHSLNLYIHRLESLQNRLGAINRSKVYTALV